MTVLVVGPLLGLLHEIEARHRYCLEHRVVEEAADPAAQERDAAAPPKNAFVRVDPLPVEDAHAPCAFDPAAFPPAVTAPDRPAAIDVAAPVSAAWQASLRPYQVTFLLLIAPKTSPPADDLV